MPAASAPSRLLASLLAVGTVIGGGFLAAAPASAATADQWPLMVTEVVPDVTGDDHFEFFEVTNTTTAPVDLDAQGIRFQYTGTSASPMLDHAPGTVIPAGASVVFWLSYATGAVDSFARTEEQFRAAFPDTAATAYDIVRVTGQPGMANGGGRGIRIVDVDGTEISEAFYAAGQVGQQVSAHFGVPSSGEGTDLEYRTSSAPTPGVIDPALLAPVVEEPEPEQPPGWYSNVGDVWPLVVTELLPDNTGADTFEYFEVVNTTDETLGFGEDGYGFRYTYVDSDARDQDVVLTPEAGATIPAGEVAVFWLNYGASIDLPLSAFREFYGIDEDVTVYRITGQAGFANGGNRGIRVVDGDDATVGWSYYAAGQIAGGRGTVHGVPATRDEKRMPVLQTLAAPTPGTVDPQTLISELQRPADPELQTASLQLTELMVNSNNIGGGDGFEYIEVYNATTSQIDWADYTIRYLYPLADLTNSSTALWPSTPRSTIIEPGSTLVLWIKNGPNDALGAAEFNAEFGTDLVLGDDLLEVFAGGMANGAPRGIEIITNTEVSFNRGYYNLAGAADVVANQGIHYSVNPADQALQLKSSIGGPTPGSVADAQVHPGLAVLPTDAAAPQITDGTASVFTPGEPLEVLATITDDVLVRTVTLELSNDVDTEVTRRNLVPDANGVYRVTIPAVDTIGKGSFTYRMTASDGVHVSDTGTRQLTSTVTPEALRIPFEEGQYLNGTVPFSAAGDVAPPVHQLTIDGAPVPGEVELERSPVFAFEATATDAYFRNGVRIGDQVLTIFDEGYYGNVVTVPSDIPLDSVNPGESFAVRIYAGTKAAPEIDPNENNDNFSVKNLRLILPDGRTLRPAEGYDPDALLPVGDSGNSKDYYEATFTVPDDAFTALVHEWDTTAVADGPHTLAASSETASASVGVVVDNTAPVITTDLEERLYQGEFVIDAEATDAGAGLASLVATLDGEEIELPHATSSLQLAAADHEVVFTATDELGNTATREVTFTTPIEEPGNELLSPEDGAEFEEETVELRARAVDPSGDELDVVFARGHRLVTDAGVTASTGLATDALSADRGDAVEVSAEQAEALGSFDDEVVTTESGSKLPYQLFEVEVPEGADDAEVNLRWDGSANADAKVLLYVLDPATGEWTEVDRHLTTGGAPTEFTLEALVAVEDYAQDGVITALVQHSEGFAGDDRSTRETVVTPNHPEDTPRSQYDFTLAWESDTQYYNASEEIYDRQLSMHEYLLRERDDLNLQYLMHTGDIVDQSEDPAQWLRADPAYDMLDEAGLPYGVLAGNHDVNQATSDYTNYSAWFGEERFAGNPWYGGSHLDNRGHYDLITAGGIDFIVLYMGWAPGDEQIDWMNEVLAQYPERVGILAQHEFMLTTGGLGPIPQRVLDEVVAVNPNVRMVSSGHYHDAYTRLFEYDDDGDGVNDRTVTAMLFDYQGLPEGGQGYLRLLHFDNQTQQIMVRTYSDYEKDYNSDDPTLELQHQEFVIPYAQAGITVTPKVLSTDAFRVDVFTTEVIESHENVESGAEVTAEWAAGEGEHSWYVRSTDPHGAVAYSEVRSLTLGVEGDPGEEPDPGAKPEQPSVPVPTDQLDPEAEGGIDAPDRVRQGDPFTVMIGADRAGQWIQLWLHSEPVALGGWTQVRADGTVAAIMPADAALGAHTLVAQDASDEVIGWTAIEVLPAVVPTDPDPGDGGSGDGGSGDGGSGSGSGSGGDDLAETGTDGGALLPLAGGALLLLALGALAVFGVAVRRRASAG